MNFENSIYHQGNTRKELPHEIEFEDINTDITKKPVQINKKSIKIIVVGDVCTGKTFFVCRHIKDEFSEFFKVTIGIDFLSKDIFWEDNTEIFLNLWDINATGISNNILKICYREASAALILFDINRPNNFYNALWWIDEINKNVKTDKNLPIPCLLIGTKCDLSNEISSEIEEQIDQLISDNKIINFFKTSAKTNININESINYIVDYIMKNNIEPSFILEEEEDENEYQEKKTCLIL